MQINRRSFLLSTAGAIAVGGGIASAQAPRTLRYTDHEPLGGMRTRFLKDLFFASVEEESGGRLKVEDHWDGAVASSYDALATVSAGTAADMTVAVPEYFAKNFPLQQLFKSFPLGPTGAAQVEFFRRAYAEIPELTAELESNGVVPVFLATGYPVAFFATAPLETLQAVRGGKWRSASFWHQDFLRNAGATPVTMRWGQEIYDALAAKTLDGLMVNVDSGFMLKVHDAAPNILVSKDLWLGHVYPIVMNRSAWDGLAQEDRDAFRRAAETSYATLGAVMDASFDAQVEELRQAGATIRVLDAAEVAQWQIATDYRKVQDDWVREQSTGVAAQPVLEKLRAIMAESLG